MPVKAPTRTAFDAPSWLRPEKMQPENASVFDDPATRTVRALMRFLGLDTPEAQTLALMGPMEVGPSGGVMGAAQRAIKSIKAYHGSPHDFDQFSMDKIGTGEGAQAYGHGLYFADREETARTYRDDLGKVVKAFGGRPTQTASEDMAHTVMSRLPKTATADDAMRMVDDWADAGVFRGKNEGQAILDVKRAISENFGKPLDTTTQGKMYEVNIHADPDDLLDWDKPLGQQSEKVRDAVHRVGREPGPHGLDRVTDDMRAIEMKKLLEPENVGKLRDAGIPGIKYLDGGSRAAGEGSRNYVIFDGSLISILRKYGVAMTTVNELRKLARTRGNGAIDRDSLNQAVGAEVF